MESFILVFLFYTDGLNLQVSLGHCRWICLMLPREQQNEGRRETVFRGDGRMAMFILDFRIGCINRGATHSFDPLLVSPCWPAVRQPLPHMMIPSDSLTVTARFDGISSTRAVFGYFRENFYTKRRMYAWSTKRSLFVKFFQG